MTRLEELINEASEKREENVQKWFDTHIDGFLNSLDNYHKEEWKATDEETARMVLNWFRGYLGV